MLIAGGDAFLVRSREKSICSSYSILDRRSSLFFGFPGQNKDKIDKDRSSSEEQNEEPKPIRLSGLIQLITAGAT
jgi:hypothetical protein